MCYLWAQVVWPGALGWHRMGAAPGPVSAERQKLWAEAAAIHVDAGPLSSWEWGRGEGLLRLLGAGWQDWGLGAGHRAGRQGLAGGEQGIRLGNHPLPALVCGCPSPALPRVPGVCDPSPLPPSPPPPSPVGPICTLPALSPGLPVSFSPPGSGARGQAGWSWGHPPGGWGVLTEGRWGAVPRSQ